MPFKPGMSGNPAGRPPGSRNKSNILLESLVEKDLEAIMQRVNDLAKDGNLAAAKLCLNVIGARRGRPVRCNLPELKTPADVLAAMRTIVSDVASGELTPVEGRDVSDLVQRFVQMYGNFCYDKRLQEVERRCLIEPPSEGAPSSDPPSPEPEPTDEPPSDGSPPHC
jgi:hypothetical protein